MRIHICGLHNVITRIKETNPDLIVSITDPGYPHQPFDTTIPAVYVQFEDTEHPNEDEHTTMVFGIKAIFNLIRNMRAMGKLSDDSTIVVHCHAGVSRSSAVAWLILMHMGVDFREAFRQLYVAHPNIWPNTQVLEIGSHIITPGVRVPEGFGAFVTQVNTEIGIDRGPGQWYV